MLFPFTKRFFELAKIRRDFVPTVINDLASRDFTGHVVLLDERQSQTVTLESGQLRSTAMWRSPAGFERRCASRDRHFQSFEEDVSVEILEADVGMAALSHQFCRAQPVWRGVGKRWLEEAKRECMETGMAVLGRLQGPVCELALVRERRIEVAYRFDVHEGVYRQVGENFWEDELQADTALELVPLGATLYPQPELAASDALTATVEKYTLVLDWICEHLSSSLGSGGMSSVNALVEVFKKKYPPLYRGVYMNPETGKVNWDHLMNNRERVNLSYRYDMFLLYLDELIMKFTQLLYEKVGVDGLKAFGKEVMRMRKITPDMDIEATRTFFRKLDKLVQAGK